MINPRRPAHQVTTGMYPAGDQINKEAWEAFLEMRTQAAAAGVQDLPLDEINAEIQNARKER